MDTSVAVKSIPLFFKFASVVFHRENPPEWVRPKEESQSDHTKLGMMANPLHVFDLLLEDSSSIRRNFFVLASLHGQQNRRE